MFAAIISAAVNIAGNAVLIPRFGLAGCAWATLIAFLAGACVYAVMLRRETATRTLPPFLAIVPAIGGALLLTMLSSPWWALAGCIMISLTIGYFLRGSLGQAIIFLKNRRAAA
jgi:Na+-driven multidrug efflux pump